MSQVERWYNPKRAKPYTIVECGGRGCAIRAKAYDVDGPWELLPKFAYLLSEKAIAAALAAPPQEIVRVRRAKKSDVLAKTNGQCYWCGTKLESKTSFCVDHIIPQSKSGGHHLENVVPCCKGCNSTKGIGTVDEFRFRRAMLSFQAQTGIFFTFAQVNYLKSIGVNLKIPQHIFWFEYGLNDPATVLANRETATVPDHGA